MTRLPLTGGAQRVDQHALQRPPASARGKDYALVDLQLDTDIRARREVHAQVRGEPVSSTCIRVIAADAELRSEPSKRRLPASAQFRLPAPTGVIEQTDV